MEESKKARGEELVVKTDHSFLQYCGRIGTDDRGRPEFVYPCSFVKFDFMGESISVKLENHWVYWDNYIGWILDGTQKKAKLPKTGSTSILLGDHLGEGIHTLLLFKRQDSCHTVSLEEFLISKGGRILKFEPLPDRRIEVYGDSVSAGEVSEAINYVGKEDPVHQGEYSNSWYSYAWLTARKLNARIHNISQGGIALMDGTGWFEPPKYIGMESVYDKVQYHPALSRTKQWEFEKYRPHVVIVALGQNDSHPQDFMKEDYTGLQAQQWRENDTGFVKKLRTLYPQAVIILTTTILCHHKNWDRAIEEVCQALGDKHVFHFLYRRNGVGTPGHIRIPEAEEMAEELSAFIKGLGETREEFKVLEHKELEFGTGGLRGVMGAGINRMNIQTVRRATQGLADYIKENGGSDRGVAIAYDSRHQSMEFARQAAMCLCGNGIIVYLFHQLTPTPLLSFAVRHLSLIAGIVITASHNPPEYNGYKVYWEDGAQITSQKEEEITRCIRKVRDYDSVPYMEEKEAENKGLLQWIGPDMEEAYLEEIQQYVLSPNALKKSAKDLTIVYTPLHGAGNLPVRHLLSRLGFSNVYVVKEQEEPDGNFSTVKNPNPEDTKAFELALKLAGKTKADLVFATDPDGDRMGVFVKEEQTGEYQRLNGNMSGILICSYLLSRRKELGLLPSNGTVIKTIVTTQMAKPLAEKYGMKLKEVLTGFKYIGELMKLLEDGDQPDYQFGFEESFGCLVETSVRDKDAVSAIMTMCEAAAFYKSMGSSILEERKKLCEEFGYYEECLETITLKREDGIARMEHIMESFRSNPPQTAGGFEVIAMEDYETGKGTKKKLLKSNVLRFLMSQDSWFCIRPSGTEPKMKFYFGVKGNSFLDAKKKLEGLKNDILNRI